MTCSTTNPKQRFPDLVDAAKDHRRKVDLCEGGGGGGDGGHHGAAGEVHHGGVEENSCNGKRGKNNHQPQYLSSRLYLETTKQIRMSFLVLIGLVRLASPNISETLVGGQLS